MLSDEARSTSFYPAFATHDAGVIDEIVKTASRGGWKQGDYEFEMLYGVRRDLQEKLIQSGQRCGCISHLEETGGHMRYDGLARVLRNVQFLLRAVGGI